MIGEKMTQALNGQVNAELYSAYLYMSMSADFESRNLRGFASWMRVQAREELAHAMKIHDHLVGRTAKVSLAAVDAPPAEWESPLAAFEAALAHERKVTGMIDDLVALAAAEKDNAAGVFLQWFVEEQVEEEASADEVVQLLRLIDGAPGGLFMLDAKLGRRTGDE